jgi:hypothetical protein
VRRHAKAPSAGSISGTGSSRARFGRAFAARGASNGGKGGGARSGCRSIAALVLASCALAAIPVVPAQAATRVEQGQFCNVAGGGAGQCGVTTGVAVNRSGAGGVSANDVYVADRGNKRVDEFTAEGTFVRAFGWDVVASGQHNTGGFEVCEAVSSPTDVCQAGSSSVSAGAINRPEGIVVDQANGNIYVADGNVIEGGNARVSIFSAKGALEGAFGWKVDASNPEAKLQFCTNASGCLAGTSSAQAGGLGSLAHPGMAVDPSGGHDIYIGESGNLRINEFSRTLNGSNEVTAVSFVRAFGGDVISGGAKGTGDVTSGSNVVQNVATTEKAFLAGQELSGNGIAPETFIAKREIIGTNPFRLSLTLSQPAVAPCAPTCSATSLIAAASAGNVARNEKQTIGAPTPVIISGNPAGKFKLKLPTDPTAAGALEANSANIAFNATPEAVEAALAATANIGANNVSVTLAPGGNPGGGTGPGGPWIVEFKGRFADTNVFQLIPVAGTPAAENIVSSVKVTTTTEGTSQQVCTTATGCQAGMPGIEGGWFRANGVQGNLLTNPLPDSPSSLAIDSGGFVYAVSAENAQESTPTTCSATNPCSVQKFNPDGSFKEAFGPSSGGAAECQLNWNAGPANVEAAGGVAVDPSNQHVLVTRKSDATHFEVCEFESSAGGAVLKDRSPAAPLLTSNAGYLSPAVSSTEHIYVNAPIGVSQGAIYILGPSPPAPGAEILSPTEITTTSAKLRGTVTVPAPGGPGFNTIYHFEYSGDNGLSWVKAPIPDASVGSVAGTFGVNQKVTGLQPNLTYRSRLVACIGSCATSSETTFSTLAEKPTISKMIALPVAGTTATLRGYLNPNNSPTSYHFEWGTSSEYGHQAPDFEPFTGSGGQPVPVSANIAGLQLSTTYHFRIVATNSFGTTPGPDASFTTDNFPDNCATESIRVAQAAAYLPDCRAYEQASAKDKRPVGIVSLFASGLQMNFQAAGDGNSVFYPILSGLSDATAGGEDRYIATRGSRTLGWQQKQVTAPALVPPNPTALAGRESTSRILYNSPDLSCGFLESFEPLTERNAAMEEDLQLGIFNLFRRNADGTYTLVTAPVPLNPSNYHELTVDSAATDCSSVLFHTGYRLLANAPATGEGLYEWSNGTLRLAGILPDGSVAQPGKNQNFFLTRGAVAGNAESRGSAFNSMSSDGSRVVFTAVSQAGGDNGKEAIFLRENGATTVDVSQSQTATPNTSGSVYQLATPDGAHVYFTARYGLALNGSSAGLAGCVGFASGGVAEGEGCDLYDYNTTTGELKDVSVDANPADARGASVVGLVDASDEGSYVYFAARGQLIPGQGRTEAENLAGATSFNLYLNHNGHLSFVAPIGAFDAGVGSTSINSDTSSRFETWAADATPDGRALMFSSSLNVTGYVSGGRREVYRYSAPADVTTCASCRPDGLESIGKPSGTALEAPIATKKLVNEGLEAVYYYRPRSISDDGRRIFFTMPDVLAPGAIAGAYNIYEWEGGKVYLIAAGEGGANDLTRYVDSSKSGNDVFFRSKAKWALQDFDTTIDLYDARVDGGYEFTTPAVPCDPLDEQCQAPATPRPSPAGAPQSEGFSGPGNQPAATKPRGHHKVKKHRKKKSKRHAKKAGRDQGGSK